MNDLAGGKTAIHYSKYEKSENDQTYFTATKYWKMTITNCVIILFSSESIQIVCVYERDKYYSFLFHSLWLLPLLLLLWTYAGGMPIYCVFAPMLL